EVDGGDDEHLGGAERARPAGDAGAEVGQNAQADALALLRMELTGKQVVARYRGDELAAVVGDGRNQGRVGRLDVVRVHEVDERPVVDSGERRRRVAFADLIPPHVRNAELRVVGLAKAHTAPAQYAEALHRTKLLALLEEQLQPETDAEKRRAALDHAAHDIH